VLASISSSLVPFLALVDQRLTLRALTGIDPCSAEATPNEPAKQTREKTCHFCHQFGGMRAVRQDEVRGGLMEGLVEFWNIGIWMECSLTPPRSRGTNVRGVAGSKFAFSPLITLPGAWDTEIRNVRLRRQTEGTARNAEAQNHGGVLAIGALWRHRTSERSLMMTCSPMGAKGSITLSLLRVHASNDYSYSNFGIAGGSDRPVMALIPKPLSKFS
jgi:hypothetical protein